MKPRLLHRIATGGFGDPLNHYAHSGAWFKGRLLIGTSRANLQFLQLGRLKVDIPHWPVNYLGENYSFDFEESVAPAEIWSLRQNHSNKFEIARVYQSPYHPFSTSTSAFRSEISYRSMCTFKDSGLDRALFVATTSRSEGDGPDILVSYDGVTFDRLPKVSVYGEEPVTGSPRVSSIRNLIQFDNLLITCGTGGSKGNINHSMNSIIYASESPESGRWASINGDGFGPPPEYFCVFSICKHNGSLYAGTAGINGFSLFKGTRTGRLDFHWELVVNNGAGRGKLNQGIVSMCSFNEFLYIGTGIQSGGYDRMHGVGPAAFELLRMNPDHSIELIVGSDREGQISRSGYGPGFSNPFNAYLWKMESHGDYLYVGTLDTSIFSMFTSKDKLSMYSAEGLSRSNIIEWLSSSGGADLRRSKDGLVWETISSNGLGNFYNYGVRTLVSNGKQLFVGTANPFGPMIWNSESQAYETNQLCGAEIFMI